MQHRLILAGDVNLKGVADAEVPFSLIGEHLRAADLSFVNLECCFHESGIERSSEDEGFHAPLESARALQLAAVSAVGVANNVNYGAPAIRSSLRRLDEVGVAHTGAGVDLNAARAPAIIERDGIRYGFLQRTSVYWSHGHEARLDYPGVATVKGHTAYRPRLEQTRALTRPGMPPEIVTWAEPEALDMLREDIGALRERCDFLVASHHWGLDDEVLDYQRQIARAAIDAGADLVMGHGPHAPMGFEYYRGKPIAYGLGSLSFNIGHFDRQHPDWVGLLLELELSGGALQTLRFRLVRHDAQNRSYFCTLDKEDLVLERLTALSRASGSVLHPDRDSNTVRVDAG
ncbi:MAG: CapA family protein [Gammaproteobacteria bacterium]|nr:CapA family protein [Gammaproteobacteria bacterium]